MILSYQGLSLQFLIYERINPQPTRLSTFPCSMFQLPDVHYRDETSKCLNVLTGNSFNVMMRQFSLYELSVRGGTNSEMSACCKFSSSLVNIMIVITPTISIRLNSPIGQSVRRCNPPRSPPKIFYSKIFRVEKYFKSILDCV